MLRGTEFADYQQVFDDAWNHILNAIVTANKYQIGVLLGKDSIAPISFRFSSRDPYSDPYLQTCMRPPESRYVQIALVHVSSKLDANTLIRRTATLTPGHLIRTPGFSMDHSTCVIPSMF